MTEVYRVGWFEATSLTKTLLINANHLRCSIESYQFYRILSFLLYSFGSFWSTNINFRTISSDLIWIASQPAKDLLTTQKRYKILRKSNSYVYFDNKLNESCIQLSNISIVYNTAQAVTTQKVENLTCSIELYQLHGYVAVCNFIRFKNIRKSPGSFRRRLAKIPK